MRLADFILDYLEGTLRPEARARFERHLSRCPACVNYIAAYQTTIALGRDAFKDDEQSVDQAGVPESLVRGILAALRAAQPSS